MAKSRKHRAHKSLHPIYPCSPPTSDRTLPPSPMRITKAPPDAMALSRPSVDEASQLSSAFEGLNLAASTHVHLENLPLEILKEIALYLDPLSAINMSQTCSRFYGVSLSGADSYFWYSLGGKLFDGQKYSAEGPRRFGTATQVTSYREAILKNSTSSSSWPAHFCQVCFLERCTKKWDVLNLWICKGCFPNVTVESRYTRFLKKIPAGTLRLQPRGRIGDQGPKKVYLLDEVEDAVTKHYEGKTFADLLTKDPKSLRALELYRERHGVRLLQYLRERYEQMVIIYNYPPLAVIVFPKDGFVDFESRMYNKRHFPMFYKTLMSLRFRKNDLPNTWEAQHGSILAKIICTPVNLRKMEESQEKRFLQAGVGYAWTKAAEKKDQMEETSGWNSPVQRVDELAFGYSQCVCEEMKDCMVYGRQLSHHYMQKHLEEYLLGRFWWDKTDDLVWRTWESCDAQTIRRFIIPFAREMWL